MAYDYDLFVIGAGSGGVRAARKASQAGARTAVAESFRVGGTCVIRGCVPKKLLVYASHYGHDFKDAVGFGWSLEAAEFSWATLIANKDREIDRLENAYRSNLAKAGVELVESRAVIDGPHTIRLERTGEIVTAERILIATGGRPSAHPALPGHEYCISSNEAFHLERLPEKILIAGGGYIAVEFAGIFNGFGVDTTLVYRGLEILSRFDPDLRRTLHEQYEKSGIRILCHNVFETVEKLPDGKFRAFLSGGAVEEADQIMLALGRLPNVEGLGLETVGVETGPNGAIKVDAYSRTNIDHIWAIGDVTDRMQLTPVAIHEAMCFVDTEFHGMPTSPDYDTVPTAIFSQPEIGTVGLAEDAARQEFANLDIYRARFTPMVHTLSGRDEKMMMKLIVNADDDRVIGCHIIGPGAGEMAQLLGIPLKMGARKADFDATMAVHPTASEELVTFDQPSERVRGGETIAA